MNQKFLPDRTLYLVWRQYSSQARSLRRCKRNLAKKGVSCEDESPGTSFYAWVEDGSYGEFQKTVRMYNLQLAPVPGQILYAVTESDEGGEEDMVQQSKQTEDVGMQDAYEEATKILLASKADAQSREENGAETEDVVSVKFKGRTITLELLAELADGGSKSEAAVKLGTSGSVVTGIIRKISGAENLQFSYYCRKKGCSEYNTNFGRGNEGRGSLQRHLNAYHMGKPPKPSVASAEVAVGLLSIESILQDLPDIELLETVREVVRQRTDSLEGELANLLEEKQSAIDRAVAQIEAEYEARILQAEERVKGFRSFFWETWETRRGASRPISLPEE